MPSGYGASSGDGNTRSIRARLVLADQLTRDGDLTQAAIVYAQVASSYANAGRAQEAVAIAHRSQSLGPEWFTIKTVGNILDALGGYGVEICTRAAEAHWRSGRVTEALQFYYQATQLDPNDAPALIRLAQAYQHQTLYKEATATFVVASRRLLEQENTTDFIAVAEQILRIDGGHAQTLRELAKAYLRVGEPRRAVAKLTALMQLVPEDPAGYEILAQAFACIGKQDVALSVLTRLANDLRVNGLEDEAEDLLFRASRWLPDHLTFQRKVAGLANDKVPTRVGPSDEEPPTRAGVMTLGAKDLSRFDGNSGVYRDPDGTNMLSIEDIAVIDDLAQTRLRDDGPAETVTRADTPPVPTPRRPPAPPDEPATRVMDDREPPTRILGDDEPRTSILGDREPATRVMDDAPPRVQPPRKPPPPRQRRKPILQKHEGTIVLDLRDLAVVGASREEEIVLDMSDVEEDAQYQLPDLVVDEESSEIELEVTDWVTVNKAAPPPVSAIRAKGSPRAAPKAPTMPVKVVRPSLGALSRAGHASVSEDAPTRPPEGRMPGKPKLTADDLDDERPTTMMSVDAAEVMKDLFKKKRTGRDRSASLLDKLGPKERPKPQRTAKKSGTTSKPTAAAAGAKPAASSRTTSRSRPQSNRAQRNAGTQPPAPATAYYPPAAGATGDTAPRATNPLLDPNNSLPPQPTPTVTGNTHVGAAPSGNQSSGQPGSPPRAKPKKTGGVRWRKPTAPKRDKPK